MFINLQNISKTLKHLHNIRQWKGRLIIYFLPIQCNLRVPNVVYFVQYIRFWSAIRVILCLRVFLWFEVVDWSVSDIIRVASDPIGLPFLDLPYKTQNHDFHFFYVQFYLKVLNIYLIYVVFVQHSLLFLRQNRVRSIFLLGFVSSFRAIYFLLSYSFDIFLFDFDFKLGYVF